MRPWLLILSCISATLQAAPLQPAPVVIFDSGQTQPLAPYYAVLAPAKPTDKTSAVEKSDVYSTPTQSNINRYLPLRTAQMTPGKVNRRSLAQIPTRGAPITPMFVIGSDNDSLRWLTAYREQLVALGAVGMLVQAENVQDLRAVAEAGQGLKITPVPGDEIARYLNLKHYPVLISHEGIEQ